MTLPAQLKDRDLSKADRKDIARLVHEWDGDADGFLACVQLIHEGIRERDGEVDDE